MNNYIIRQLGYVYALHCTWYTRLTTFKHMREQNRACGVYFCFNTEMALRQGCFLSPLLLFIIVIFSERKCVFGECRVIIVFNDHSLNQLLQLCAKNV